MNIELWRLQVGNTCTHKSAHLEGGSICVVFYNRNELFMINDYKDGACRLL